MTVFMLLEMARSADPQRVVLTSESANLTADDMYRLALGGASLLTETGAESVAYLGVNGPEFAVALFAAAGGGLPFTPLNYRLAGAQLREMITTLPHPVVLYDETFASVVDGLAVPAISTSTWLAAASASQALERDHCDGDQLAAVLFTSGTTSTPKRATLRHRHLVSYVLQTVELGSADPTATFLVAVPPYHIAGIGTVLTNVYAGRRMVFLPDFAPAAWLRLARRENVTDAMVVPTMLSRIVDELDGRPADVPSLRSLAYGGARMPLPVLTAAMEAFAGVDFTNAYGLTETSSTLALLDPDHHREALSSDDPEVRARLGSVGQVLPGVEVEIRDPQGRALPPGETGQLWVRGSQISGEYAGSGSTVDDAGWFDTRDSAYLDSEGFLFIVGRSDDTIIRGGENIAPAEIEDVLVAHPEVAQAAVTGAPDDQWGAKIVAVVVPRRGAQLSAEAIKGWARTRLRGSRTPDEVLFRDDLPYTPTGKLLRRHLLMPQSEMVTASLGSQAVADEVKGQ